MFAVVPLKHGQKTVKARALLCAHEIAMITTSVRVVFALLSHRNY